VYGCGKTDLIPVRNSDYSQFEGSLQTLLVRSKGRSLTAKRLQHVCCVEFWISENSSLLYSEHLLVASPIFQFFEGIFSFYAISP